MEHRISSLTTTPSSQESDCVFTFDRGHQLLNVSGGTEDMPQVIVQPPPRPSAVYGHCSPDPLLAQSSHVSPPYHFGLPQYPLPWPTSLSSSPPFSPSNAQLHEPVSLQPPLVSPHNPAPTVGPQAPVCGFVEPFFQRHQSSLQHGQPYQEEMLSRHNMMGLRQPQPGGGVDLWNPHHQPLSHISHDFFNYNRPPPHGSQVLIWRPVSRHPQHSPYPHGNLPQVDRRLYHSGLSSFSHNCNAAGNDVVRPIPIYRSRPLPGFRSPSSVQFEIPTTKNQSEVRNTQVTDKKDHKEVLGDEGQKEIIIEHKLQTAGTSINPSKLMMKKRESVSTIVAIDSEVECQLEDEFQSNTTPSQAEISAMSGKYKILKSVVRSWFCNRRQKQKKLEKIAATSLKVKKKTLSTSRFKSNNPVSKLVIPSQTHDITVEVPSINPKDRGSIIHKDYV